MPHGARRDRAGVRRMAGFGYVLAFLRAAFFFIPIIVLGLFGRYAEAASLSILITVVRLVPEVAAPVLEGMYFPRIRYEAVVGTAPALLRRSTFAVLALTIPPAVALAMLAGPTLHLLFGARYDHAAEHLPVLAILIVAIPLETLFGWTLLASESGRPAIVGLMARCVVVLAGALAFGFAGAAASFDILVIAPVGAVVGSLVIHAIAIRRWLAVAAARTRRSDDDRAAEIASGNTAGIHGAPS